MRPRRTRPSRARSRRRAARGCSASLPGRSRRPSRRPRAAARSASSAGDSRMSSVSGLNARPQIAICLPSRLPPKCAMHALAEHALLALVRALDRVDDRRAARRAAAPVWTSARRSFGKHEPPKPAPANRNLLPMRGSEPMPLRTASMSAPTTSHEARQLVHERDARREHAFAAYFVISAERMSITWRRSFVRNDAAIDLAQQLERAADRRRRRPRARACRKSLTASPSLRNSGFDATANGCFAIASRSRSRTLSAVPTGTVLFVTTTVKPSSACADLLRGVEHVLEVGAAVGARRRADRDEHDLRARDRLGGRGREAQAPAACCGARARADPARRIGISPRRSFSTARVDIDARDVLPKSAKPAPVTSPT